MMIEMTSMAAIEKFISTNPFSCLYISRSSCGVCQAVLPQLKNLLSHYPRIRLCHINADSIAEVAGRFSVFTVPALLLFVDGKETIRVARFFHMESLDEQIGKLYSLLDNQ